MTALDIAHDGCFAFLAFDGKADSCRGGEYLVGGVGSRPIRAQVCSYCLRHRLLVAHGTAAAVVGNASGYGDHG